MLPVLFRLALLTLGMGIVEIELGDAAGIGSPVAWAIIVLVGLPLIAWGGAGVFGTLFVSGRSGGRSRDANDS